VDMALFIWDVRGLLSQCNNDDITSIELLTSELSDLFEKYNIVIDELIN